ncbi:hypothetical protein C0J52_15036, partial [Blattella germanica]
FSPKRDNSRPLLPASYRCPFHVVLCLLLGNPRNIDSPCEILLAELATEYTERSCLRGLWCSETQNIYLGTVLCHCHVPLDYSQRPLYCVQRKFSKANCNSVQCIASAVTLCMLSLLDVCLYFDSFRRHALVSYGSAKVRVSEHQSPRCAIGVCSVFIPEAKPATLPITVQSPQAMTTPFPVPSETIVEKNAKFPVSIGLGLPLSLRVLPFRTKLAADLRRTGGKSEIHIDVTKWTPCSVRDLGLVPGSGIHVQMMAAASIHSTLLLQLSRPFQQLLLQYFNDNRVPTLWEYTTLIYLRVQVRRDLMPRSLRRLLAVSGEPGKLDAIFNSKALRKGWFSASVTKMASSSLKVLYGLHDHLT